MASHQLAIAKASFSAGLLRPDPTSLSREDIARFHSLLNSVVIQCTPINVQKCKQWILENIVQSTARCTALGKYLTALTASFSPNGLPLDPSSKREPSMKRKRLHMLFLVNDILYHAKYRVNDASICGKLQPILMSLLGSTASFKGCPKHHRKIQSLLLLWEENGYYSKDYVDKLREAVKNASELGIHEDGPSGAKDQDSTAKTAKAAPFVMPAMHGDTGTPWFDLPAGNLMPHIIPNSTRPINPDMIKPLQFVAGPADEGLVLAVTGLLDDVQKIFGGETDQDEKVFWDIDELGQPIILDEITGEVLEGEGYYGWSRAFCEKMKRRRKGLDMPDQDEDRGRRSRSGSSSPGRKRRYSQSGSRSPHRSSRLRRYSSSRSRSRSSPPKSSRSRSRARSPAYSRSLSPRRDNAYPPIPDPQDPKPLGQDMSYQNGFNGHGPPPPPPPGPLPHMQYPPPNQSYGIPPNMPQNMPPHMPPHMPYNMPYNAPYGGSPQQEYGSWAAPQPPVNAFANSPWPPPPPPPGPPPFQQQHQRQFQQHPGFPPPGPGGWQPPNQPNMPGPGGWQPPNNGRGGYNNNNGWNNGQQGGGGRGNYRGRGW